MATYYSPSRITPIFNSGVWQAANTKQPSYLPLTGGTLSGSCTFNSGLQSNSTITTNNLSISNLSNTSTSNIVMFDTSTKALSYSAYTSPSYATITISAVSGATTATTYNLGSVSLSSGIYLINASIEIYTIAINTLQVFSYIGTNSTGGLTKEPGWWASPCPTYTNGGVQYLTVTFSRIVKPTSTTTYYINVRPNNISSGTLNINPDGASEACYVKLA